MTAVEWLTEKLRTEFGFAFSNNILEQAKEMEKQQQADAWNDGMKSDNGHFGTFEEYYTKTFKSE